MKEHALDLARAQQDPARRLNILREYLQALVLRALHDSEAFRCLVFVGGTALRFLHGLPRFSEDLDFSLSTWEGYSPESWLRKLKKDLTLGGFNPELSWNDKGPVHKGWVRLIGLISEAGISGRREQKLSIKLEVDTRPPAGAVIEQHILTRHVTFFLTTHSLPSLFAGKLHALICRPYPKGRDWFDLVWYLSHRPAVFPNISLLQHALDQTHSEEHFQAKEWRRIVLARLGDLPPDVLRKDVNPFLERPEDGALVSRENLTLVLDTAGK